MRHTLRISDQRILCLFCVLRISMNTFEGLLLVCNCVMLLRITQPTLGCGAHCVLRIAYYATHFGPRSALRIAYCVLRIAHTAVGAVAYCVLRIAYSLGNYLLLTP